MSVFKQSKIACTMESLRFKSPCDNCVYNNLTTLGHLDNDPQTSKSCRSLAHALCTCVPVHLCVILAAASEPAGPEIIEPPKNVYERIGSEVNLTCIASGVPQPTITWYKDDALLPDEVAPLLLIQDLSLDTRGLYMCVATNEHNSSNTTAYVKIKGAFRFCKCVRR